MSFPFDALDIFIPEIAHWMAGRSTSDKQRFLRAGVGLLLTGIVMAAGFFFLPGLMEKIFFSLFWGYFLVYLFSVCGIGLLVCLLIDRKINE